MTLGARVSTTWTWTILVLYVLVVGIGGGLVLGAGIASVVLVPGVFEKATGLLASTAVTAIAIATFRQLPSLTDDPGHRTSAKRFLVILILVSAFLGGLTFIRLGNQGRLPFGVDRSFEARLLEIEFDVGNLKETYSADVYREDRINQRPRIRRWWRIPTTPGQRFQLQAELSGVRASHWIEIVVTDERGQLLAGRRTLSSSAATVAITSGQSWFVNVGVRWWPDGNGQTTGSLRWPNGTQPASDDQKFDTQDPEASGLIRVTRRPETAVTAQASPPGAGAVDLDKTSFRASAGATQSTSYLASSCGGAQLDERAYTLEVPADSWIHVEAESREPVLLYVMKSNAMVANEVSCDRDAFAVTAGAATLQSELDVAVPRGKYVIVVDGLNSVHQDVRLSGEIAGLGLNLEDGSNRIELESAAITTRVDLLGTPAHGRECGDELVRYYRDIEVSAAAAGLYRAEVLPSPEYQLDSAGGAVARSPFHLRWRKGSRECADVADRQLAAGETAVLRVIGYAGIGPDVGGLGLHLVGQNLKPTWCTNAAKFDVLTKKHPLQWSGATSPGAAVFTPDQCPDAVAGQLVDTGGGQAFAQFKLAQDTVLAMTGRTTSASLPNPRFYIVRVAASATTTCDPEPKVVACCVVSDATKVFTLPLGSYYIVVAGQHKADAGAFSVDLHRLASAPRPDAPMAL
jgi:hypothetical protein